MCVAISADPVHTIFFLSNVSVRLVPTSKSGTRYNKGSQSK